MKKISATIITFNEEKNIERCLESLQGIVDEIIVVDSFSTDGTKEICLKHQVNFFERTFIDYSEQKNWALEQTKYSIILSIDADEVLSEELKSNILKVKNNWKADAYTFKRMTNYCGRWIRHSGWYPDSQLRLWDKEKGKWDGNKIHEKVQLVSNSTISKLKGNLLHYSFYSIQQHIDQINKFSELKADQLFQKGKKTNGFKIIFSPLFKFIKHYIFNFGFLDGFYGFVICVNSAHSSFLKQVKLRQKNHAK
ncbi:MAG: glycosyltransferase family 2 protein [Marinilabiliales bacterium]|nr:MAG: glycosyltransferase family 2 protein [Marinilabiliales bacterium]